MRATVDYIVSEGLYNFHLYENEADRVRKVEEMINEVGLRITALPTVVLPEPDSPTSEKVSPL